MKNVRLTVVIVNYNVKSYLYQCLHSVERAFSRLSMEVIVVDNASTDNSVAELSMAFPWVTFLLNTENLGFAKANNQAIRLAKGDYVLLLNPDTIVGEEVFDECVAFMDNHADAGALGVKMLRADGGFAWESRRGVPTPFTAFCKMTGLCSLFPRSRVFGRYYMRYLDDNEVARIDIVSGAFMMLRRSALDEIGLLDETFFMYGEDIDLSYRLLKAGYSNYYLPRLIVHYKGESTRKTSFRYVRTFYNAMLIFYNKHFADRNRILTWMVRLAVLFFGSFEFIFQQRRRLDIHTDERYRLLVVGTSQACWGVEAICKQEGIACTSLVIETEEEQTSSLPLGKITQCKENAEKPFTHIVFDANNIAYSDVLTYMQREFQRRDTPRMELGFFSVDSGRLLFASDCFVLKKDTSSC